MGTSGTQQDVWELNGHTGRRVMRNAGTQWEQRYGGCRGWGLPITPSTVSLLSIIHVWSFATNLRTANEGNIDITLQADVVVLVYITKELLINSFFTRMLFCQVCALCSVVTVTIIDKTGHKHN